MKGKFFVLEGGEGSGKSSCISYLMEKLPEFIFTYEPGGTQIAENIRRVLMNSKNVDIVPMAEIFLFCAARAQHCEELIVPMLNSGKNVVCDRFDGSTLAYQIFGRQRLSLLEAYHILNRYAKGTVKPDLVIYLDVKPMVGIRRRNLAGNETRFDKENINFHKRVRKGYLYAQSIFSNWILVDAHQTLEKEKEEVLKIIQKFTVEART